MGGTETSCQIAGVVTLLFALLRCSFVAGEAAHIALRLLDYRDRVPAGHVAGAER